MNAVLQGRCAPEQHNSEALGQILLVHSNELLGHLTGLGYPDDVAEDAVQDALIRALRRDLSTITSLGGWLRSLAVNAATTAMRAKNRQRLLARKVARDVVEHPLDDPVSEAERRDQSERVAEIVRKLPEEMGKVVIFWATGHSYRETAAHFSMSVGKIASLLHRARKAILSELVNPKNAS